ncbi:phosphorylated adapter RNA export protein [Teleopsis dalmanni]|uniref:phosphorylated adapter RNA export protein n=1 Tax=Teleopsis dalmanni TaxID=139649 RepID=UPI0018CEF473|nr:phosphorylated adapter RNA export protein [Teleopsis dalmanni]
MEPIDTEISTDAELQNMYASDGVLKLCESDDEILQSDNEANANELKAIESSDELYEPLQRPTYVAPKIECNNDVSQVSLEDGELLDPDSSNDYEPLQRRNTFTKSTENKNKLSSDSENSSDNSFSGLETFRVERKVQKKRPIMVRVNTPNETRTKFKKNNVWAKALEEETLTETMRSINVTSDFLVERNVESYPMRYINRKRRLSSNDDECFISKRHRRTASNEEQDEGFDFSRLGDKPRHNKGSNKLKKQRYIPDLKDIEGRDATDIAHEIAENLHEHKSDLIERILNILGVDIPIEIYKKTQAIEEEGGMMVLNGTRRRTSGGVYFYLLKGDSRVSKEKHDEIFEFDKEKNSKWAKSIKDEARDRKVEELKQRLKDHDFSNSKNNFLLGSDLSAENQSGNLSNPPPSPVGNDNSSNVVPEVNLQSPVRSPVTTHTVSTESKYLDEDVIDLNYEMDLF